VNGCLYAEALRVGDSKAQLAAIALRKQWESDQHKNKRESLRNTHGRFEMLWFAAHALSKFSHKDRTARRRASVPFPQA
jgi:hypothetical protein